MTAYQTMLLDGKTVRYIDQGDGAAVVLLHGWGTEAVTYHLIIEHLSRRYRVIAPDMPGFGGTYQPETVWGGAEYVAFVRAFLAALDVTEAVLMGHSHGGRVSIRLLADPQGFTCQKAVLLDAAGLPAHHSLKWHIKVKSYKLGKAILGWAPVKALFPHALEKLQKNAGSADYRQASPVMKQTMSRVLAEDVSDCLPKITASTLLIWGDKDTATPRADGQKMEKLIPDAGLVVLPGGHFAFAENWARTAAVLDAFL